MVDALVVTRSYNAVSPQMCGSHVLKRTEGDKIGRQPGSTAKLRFKESPLGAEAHKFVPKLITLTELGRSSVGSYAASYW